MNLETALELLEIYRRRLAWDGKAKKNYSASTMAQTLLDLDDAGETELAMVLYGDFDQEIAREVRWRKMRALGINEKDVAEARWPDPPAEL